jgi:hypothetical protein
MQLPTESNIEILGRLFNWQSEQVSLWHSW